MEWLRLVGSLKLKVSFAEHSLFYRALAKPTYNFKEPIHRSHPIPAGTLEQILYTLHNRVSLPYH